MDGLRSVRTRLFCDRMPSRGVVRDDRHSQHVIVEHRSGAVSKWTARLIGQVLADIEGLNNILRQSWLRDSDGEHEPWSGPPRVLLRLAFVDDKHGAVRLIVDLHHQAGHPSYLTNDAIAAALHDGYAWYEGQAVSVGVRVRPVMFQSDHYFDLADDWYSLEDGS